MSSKLPQKEHFKKLVKNNEAIRKEKRRVKVDKLYVSFKEKLIDKISIIQEDLRQNRTISNKFVMKVERKYRNYTMDLVRKFNNEKLTDIEITRNRVFRHYRMMSTNREILIEF